MADEPSASFVLLAEEPTPSRKTKQTEPSE